MFCSRQATDYLASSAESYPVFIVGLPRSGTKLIRSILNGSSRIFIARIETDFLPYWVKKWEEFGDLSEISNFRKFYARCQRLPYFEYMHRENNIVGIDRWHSQCREFTPQAVFEALIKADAEFITGEIWGDKSPSYVEHLPLLKELFPDARVIHVVRDVRDYCLSIHAAWGKQPLRAAQRWVDGIAAARAASNAFTTDYLEVKYESVLESPVDTVKEMCDFLSIEFDPGMLEFTHATENIGAARFTKGIYAKNLRKYEYSMSEQQCLRIEQVACTCFVSWGIPSASKDRSAGCLDSECSFISCSMALA